MVPDCLETPWHPYEGGRPRPSTRPDFPDLAPGRGRPPSYTPGVYEGGRPRTPPPPYASQSPIGRDGLLPARDGLQGPWPVPEAQTRWYSFERCVILPPLECSYQLEFQTSGTSPPPRPGHFILPGASWREIPPRPPEKRDLPYFGRRGRNDSCDTRVLLYRGRPSHEGQ